MLRPAQASEISCERKDMTTENVSTPPPSPAIDSPDHTTYAFGPFRIDLSAKRLWRDDAVVPLTARAFDTLVVLVKNHNHVVTKDELIRAVWPDSFVSDDSLVQNVSALRRALGDDPNQAQYIVTVARHGYRFIAAVERNPGSNAGHVEPASPRAAAVTARGRFRWISREFVTGFVLGFLVLETHGLLVDAPTQATKAAIVPILFHENLAPELTLIGGVVLSP